MADAAADDVPTDLAGLGADVGWTEADPGSDRTAPPDAGRLGELASWWARVAANPDRGPTRARLVVIGERAPAVDAAELAGAGVRHIRSTELGFAAGIRLADAEIDEGADLVAVAVPGAEVDALTLVSVLTNTEPVKVMPRGASVDPQTWMAQVAEVRDRRRAAFEHRANPDTLARSVGSPALDCAAALILRAAARRTPLVLDGVGAVAAGLLAHAVSHRASHWWQVADGARHPAVGIATAKLEQRPILDLGIATSDGTAGALAVLVLRTAVHAAGRPAG